MGTKLTERQRAFVDHFIGACRGNGAKAARASGYMAKNARHYASRLLTKANIRQAIAGRVQKREELTRWLLTKAAIKASRSTRNLAASQRDVQKDR